MSLQEQDLGSEVDITQPPSQPPKYEIDSETPNKDNQQDQEQTKSKPAKKSVGFAPPPEDDLKEHHEYLKQKQEIEIKSSPFHKIPPELSYLDKQHMTATPKPKPITDINKPQIPNSRLKLTDLPDLSKLKFFDIKDLSVQNKETELQFHYTTLNLPTSSDSVIVDIKYGSLNSFDLCKINQYLLNLSNIKVGLGYEFAGVITNVGSSLNSKFSVGDIVFGLIDPTSRRGALSTSQIIYPGRDVLIKIDEDTLKKIEETDICLNPEDKNIEGFEVGEEEEENNVGSNESGEQSKQVTEVEDDTGSKTSKTSSESQNLELSPLAKLSSISLLYNHSKQMIQHLNDKTKKVNILINGADTNIGLTIIQILLTEHKNLEFISFILVIREKSEQYMNKIIKNFEKKYYDPSRIIRFKIVTFDIFNDGLYFPGEKIPISYKKPDFFATEIIDSLLVPHDNELVNETNINNYKLDLFIDLIGCKKYFQSSSTKFHEIDTLNLPFKQNISVSIEKLFNSSKKEPFLNKILKPKKMGSTVVSGCKFTLSDPSYNINKLIDFNEQNYLNPWTNKFTKNLFNNFTEYNYFEEIFLKIKQEWCNNALQLVLENKLKFKIDGVYDWRKDYKKYIKNLTDNDGKIVFKVEDF
ncbi:uncharacterized protein KGF55_003761 [Candida pseudojiufengensis]|uniref:uncharacterized protein n=1 Tax=Candida pseudojiufengensis TaxID=497109 RepID=UPI0022245D6F|nr:uncharacterized protein KGF55_003761 [Candida pseudojiufengensis]KAI5962685.1 hypothetical protein KGF55_003761 [Candida pseudojiufengensis]